MQGRMDLKSFLSHSELNVLNKGGSVGIMWEPAHAAVTNAVKPNRLTGGSASPLSQNAARLALLTTNSLLLEDRQDLFARGAACGCPAGLLLYTVCWSRSRCVYVPVRARFSFFLVSLLLLYPSGSRMFLNTYADSELYVSKSKCKCFSKWTVCSKVHVSTSLKYIHSVSPCFLQ